MTTETPDDVAVPHFENRLWRELARAHDTFRREGMPPPPRRRRPGRRPLVLGVGAAAAAAALITAVVVIDSDGGRTVRTADDRTATTSTTTAPPDPGAALADRMAAAAEQLGTDYVLHEVQHMVGGSGDSETWVDGRSGARRSLQRDEAGAPAFDSGRATPPALDAAVPPEVPPGAMPDDPSIPRVTERQVDHCFQEYTDSETWDLPATDDGEMIADQLRDGSLIEDGTEVVDGRELIRLVETLGSIGAGGGGARRGGTSATTTVAGDPAMGTPTTVNPDEVLGIYLVDPETSRPVRRIGYPGSSAEYVMTFEYLPRTPQTLAQLAVPVPEGFTQVENLRGDGERTDAGCT